MSDEQAAFVAGLIEFFRVRQMPVREVSAGEAGRFTVWVDGEDAQAMTHVVEALSEISQLVGYRHHPTSEAVLELYTLEAHIPRSSRGLHRLPRQSEAREAPE